MATDFEDNPESPIDMTREVAAIIRKIEEFEKQGFRRGQLQLFVCEDFRKRLIKHFDCQYIEQSFEQSLFLVPLKVADVEGWLLKAPDFDFEPNWR